MQSKIGRYKIHLGIAFAFLVGFICASIMNSAPARADWDLGGLVNKGIKVVGVGVLVDQFGGEINKFINQFMDQNSVQNNSSSKVVEIISPIGGKHIGACQVTGPKDQVDKVGAVVQLETNANIGTKIRLKAMVPIEGKDPTDLKRVPGVGLSALIDIKL